MVMTNDEIVMEYKQAKNHFKQISILADQNLCRPKDIVQVLLDADCEVPKQYLPKSKAPIEVPEAVAPVPAAIKQAAELYTVENIKAIALDVIGELVETEASDYFSEQVRGIFTFIKHIEGGK